MVWSGGADECNDDDGGDVRAVGRNRFKLKWSFELNAC